MLGYIIAKYGFLCYLDTSLEALTAESGMFLSCIPIGESHSNILDKNCPFIKVAYFVRMKSIIPKYYVEWKWKLKYTIAATMEFNLYLAS